MGYDVETDYLSSSALLQECSIPCRLWGQHTRAEWADRLFRPAAVLNRSSVAVIELSFLEPRAATRERP